MLVAQIEREFAALFSTCATLLSKEEMDDIQRFVDVGEYAIALEEVVGTFEQKTLAPPNAVVELMSRLARTMSMDEKQLLDHLPKTDRR
jgi:hypothetical protein